MTHMDDHPTEHTLVLKHAGGDQSFPIEQAVWNFYIDKKGRSVLVFRVRSEPRASTSSDDPYVTPLWEIVIKSPALTLEALAPGATFMLPEGYDYATGEYATDFYLFEHEDTQNTCVEVLRVDGERLLVRMTGTTLDPFIDFDSAEQPLGLKAEAWFDRDQSMRRFRLAVD
jgi:hypothetical protein